MSVAFLGAVCMVIPDTSVFFSICFWALLGALWKFPSAACQVLTADC